MMRNRRKLWETCAWGPLVSLVCLMGCTLEPRPLPEVPEGAQASPEGSGAGSQGPQFDWTYSGANGPAHWSELNADWAACAGPEQSPIDVPLDVLAGGGKVEPAGAESGRSKLAAVKTWTPQFSVLPLEARSDGRVVQLSGAGSQGLAIDGRLAQLSKIEIHAPAEHKLGGVQSDVELVLFMRDSELGELALSLLFRVGAPQPELNALIERLPKAGAYEAKLLGGTLALPHLIPPGAQLLAYSGSLSQPPCSIGLQRLIVARVGEISAAQLTQLKAALPGMSQRPVLPLGERKVSLIQLSEASPAPAKDLSQQTVPSVQK